MITEERFRAVMGRFATGVTVVTTRTMGGECLGLTANAFTSVSLDPLQVLVCIHREAAAHDALLEAGFFAVNVLAREDKELALRFSRGEARERLQGVESQAGVTGSPLLPGVLAWLECEVRGVHPGGDHSIIVGEVVACDAGEGSPLLFFRGEMVEGWSP